VIANSGKTTILRFCNLLEKNSHARDLLSRRAIAIDTNITSTPNSTKIRTSKRDPEMHHPVQQPL